MDDSRHSVKLWDRSFEPFIRHEDIIAGIERIAGRLNADYGGGEKGIPLFIGVLNGAFMFLAELLQRIEFPCEVSFVKLYSYSGTDSTGTVTEVIGLREGICGRHIIVAEDIVDTGASITNLTGSLSAMDPATVEVATMLFKPTAYGSSVPVRYAAIEIPDVFIVGFGMDYNGLGRNLGDIYRIVDDGYDG